MADERKQKTAESRLNDVLAGDELGQDNRPERERGKESERKDSGLRDVNDRAEDEQRAWSGDLDARVRRGRDELYNDGRGDQSDLAWGAGGMQSEDRSDSITAIPADGRATHDDKEQ